MKTRVKKQLSAGAEALKKEYAKRYPNDVKMYEFCVGRISDGLILENGTIYEFEKPTIKKRFCYGAGQNASCTDEEQSHASDMVNKASNDEKYFIDENIKSKFSFFDRIFEDMARGWGLYACPKRYDGTTKAVVLYSEKLVNDREELGKKYQKLTAVDIENLKKMIDSEKNKFIKRLECYLKKYGLSKVDAWSYIVD